MIYHCQVIINKVLGVLANYENCYKATINNVRCNKSQRAKNLSTSLSTLGNIMTNKPATYQTTKKINTSVKAALAGLLLTTILTTAPVAKAEKGWFVRPEAELTFTPADFTRGLGKVGIGGGLSFGFGYQFDAWQWETNVGWHYAGGKNVVQKIGKSSQTANISENFIPIYTGINYTFPFLQSIDTTIGVGGGVMIYKVDKTFSPNGAFNDSATVAKALLVPKVELDYALTDNLTLTVAGKFYLIFNGFSDLYSTNAIAAANTAGQTLNSNKLLWYGSLAVGTSYRF